MIKNQKDFITFENGKVFLNSGFSKINATMVFKIGLAVGSKNTEGIEYLKVSK